MILFIGMTGKKEKNVFNFNGVTYLFFVSGMRLAWKDHEKESNEPQIYY